MSSKTKTTAMKEEARPALVPKLRFPGFQNAGEWEIDALGQLADYENGKAYEQDIVENGKYVVVNSRFISTDGAVRKHTNAEYLIAKAGDVLMVLSDLPKGRALAKCYFVESDDRYAVNQRVCRLKPRRIDGKFLYYTLNRHPHLLAYDDGLNQTHLSKGGVTECPLRVPTQKAEQQKIAECLSSVDELMAAQARKVDALKTHKKGLMQQLFPREGETQPRLRFPEFRSAGEWDDGELGPKASKVGSGITPTGGDRNYKLAGRPFVRSQNVGWGILVLDEVAYIDEETHASFSSTEIKVTDVLLNITGASIGRSAVADERVAGGNVNQHVCIIRTKPNELNPFFLNQYLISQRGQKQIDSFQAGGNRQGLNFAQIRSFAVPLPPTLAEQQHIATCLSSLDALITAETKKLEALKTHKKGLMQQLFPSPDEVEA